MSHKHLNIIFINTYMVFVSDKKYTIDDKTDVDLPEQPITYQVAK